MQRVRAGNSTRRGHRARVVLCGMACGLMPLLASALPSLQELVDATPPGGELVPPPGRYPGPLMIRRPIKIDGKGAVTIDAGGRGTVVVIRTNGAELRRLRLVGSGSNHDTLDAAIQVRGNDNRILDNVIEDCLFGVDLKKSDRNQVRGNRIRSKDLPLGLRGDSVRLWWSFDNRITDNVIQDVRDMVIWYSDRNRIARNRVTGSRYALHFMYAKTNRVEANRYIGNTAGIFLMYSDGVVLSGNEIRGSAGPTGMGVGVKESSGVVLQDNVVEGNARGIYLDVSPYDTTREDRFERNRIAYNGVGVLFHNDWPGNLFKNNDFRGNFSQVAVSGGGGATHNTWVGNYWDDYQGFDRDRDHRGDTPYQLYAYADRIWMDQPNTAFFRGSPLFEVIDFLDRLAPFVEPTLILRDPEPRFHPLERDED